MQSFSTGVNYHLHSNCLPSSLYHNLSSAPQLLRPLISLCPIAPNFFSSTIRLPILLYPNPIHWIPTFSSIGGVSSKLPSPSRRFWIGNYDALEPGHRPPGLGLCTDLAIENFGLYPTTDLKCAFYFLWVKHMQFANERSSKYNRLKMFYAIK